MKPNPVRKKSEAPKEEDENSILVIRSKEYIDKSALDEIKEEKNDRR